MHVNAEDLAIMLDLDLYEAGWCGQTRPPVGSHQRQFAMSALHNSFLKKFHNEDTDPVRDKLALQLFLECNERCLKFINVLPRRLNEELIIGEMKSIIYDFFNPEFREEERDNLTGHVSVSSFREPFLLNLSAIAKCFGLGNGSNIGAPSTDLYSKYANSMMSHTGTILPVLFRQALSSDKLWSDVEAYRANRFGFESVSGNRLSFVPKSRLISRTICTEPLMNMFFQKGIGGVITRRLKEVFGIDLSDQPVHNSHLAQIGSRTGRFGTIDLSSASDSISIAMLRDMMPREPLDWLLRCRSPSTILPDGTVIDLHMISSMGNGFTFPLQTMIFASLVKAAYKVYGLKFIRPNRSSEGNFAVFGDDIIVDERVYNAVVSCLEILGFSVNLDKSFNTGTFRESCGHDYISGLDIRGVYLKTLLDASDIYSAINRLNIWSTRHGIFLTRTIGLLRRGCRFIGVPYDESDDAGIKIPFSMLRNPAFNSNGAVKYLALVRIARRVAIPNAVDETDLTENELRKVRRLLPSFDYNSDAVMFCLLAGWIKGGFIGLRSDLRKAVLRKRVCPGWDARVFARGESREFADRWKAVVEANFVN